MLLAGTSPDPGSVSGLVYVDNNANGIQDEGDGLLAGATVFVDADNDLRFDANIDTCFATTQADGTFRINGIDPDVVNVRIDLIGVGQSSVGLDGAILTQPDGTPEGDEPALPPGTELTTLGYRTQVLANLDTGGLVFGVADAMGENTGPVVADQQFNLIEYDVNADNLGLVQYPQLSEGTPSGTDIVESQYIVGSIEGFDPDNDPLFYKIIGGNLGDEQKAFRIIRDAAEAADYNAANPGLPDGPITAGTILVQNEFMINRRFEDPGNGGVNAQFNLQVLVSDDDPDLGPATDPGRELGVDGNFDVVDVQIDVVPFNRIQEQEVNDSLDNAQDINAGGEAHNRLNIAFDLENDFFDQDILGDPANNQFGPTEDQFAFIDGSIEDRSGIAGAVADVDFYRIDVTTPTGLFLDIDAAELGSTLDAQIRIVDADGNALPQPAFQPEGVASNNDGYDFERFVAPVGAGSNDARSVDSSLYVDLVPTLTGGTYYIIVEGANGTSGDYRLKMFGDKNYNAGVPDLDTVDIDNDGTPDFQEGAFPAGDQFVVYLDFDGQENVEVPPNLSVIPQGDPQNFRDLEAFNFSDIAANGINQADFLQFTPAERLAMQNIFRIVREDFSPYSVNVTTNEADFNAAGIGNRYRVIFTETPPEDFAFASPVDVEGFTILPLSDNDPGVISSQDETGIVFTSNVLTYSGDSTNPISGRIVASALESGNYATNVTVLGLNEISGNEFYAPYNGFDTGGGGSAFPDAVIGVADTGLNQEIWKRGINSDRFLQNDTLELHNFNLGWRDGGSDDIDGDEEGQLTSLNADPFSGDGGETGSGNDSAFAILDDAANLAGRFNNAFNDPRELEVVYEATATITHNNYNDPPRNWNETDYDMFRFSPGSDDWRLYVDVDEYATNMDLRVEIFQFATQGAGVINRRTISFQGDGGAATPGVYDDSGDALDGAAIAQFGFDGKNISTADAYITSDDYTQYEGNQGLTPQSRGDIYVYITSPDRLNPTAVDRHQGLYDVTLIRQTDLNQQPDGPDQTIDIVLDENTEQAPFFEFFQIGDVNLGSGITNFGQFSTTTNIYDGDPQNPRDDGRTGQIWQFSIVDGNQIEGPDGNPLTDDNGDIIRPFAINDANGEIFVARPDLIDFELKPVYSLQVRVTDNGNPARTAPVTVNITLRDINEVPTADSPQDLGLVQENRVNGAVIGQVEVTDPDDADGAPLTPFRYRVRPESSVRVRDAVTGQLGPETNVVDLNGTQRSVASFFTIDSSGRVVVADRRILDFEQFDDFSLSVDATEDRVGGITTDPFDVTFRLSDVQENPFFNPNPPFTQQIAVDETDPDGTVVVDGSLIAPNTFEQDFENVVPIIDDMGDDDESNDVVVGFEVVDEDGDGTAERQTITFSLSADTSEGGFAIDPDTGEITILDADRIDFESDAPGLMEDGNGNKFFGLTVTATDSGDPNVDPNNPRSASFTFQVQVLNISPEPPSVLDQSATIAENPADDPATAESELLIGTIDFDDDDLDNDPNESLTIFFKGDATLDPGNAPQTIRGLAIEDVIELNQISNMQAEFSVVDTQAARRVFNREALPAADDNPNVGLLTFEVVVEDASGERSDAVITVRVTDVVEDPPTGTTPQGFAVDETAAEGTPVTPLDPNNTNSGQLLADHADPTLAEYGDLRYQFVGGTTETIDGRSFSVTSDGAFRIDRGTGRIFVNDDSQLDFESQNRYGLDVEVYGTYDQNGLDGEDEAIDPLGDVVRIRAVIVLNDVNEPPFFAEDFREVTIDENTRRDTVVAAITAFDPEQQDVSIDITAEVDDNGQDVSGAFAIQTVSDSGRANLVVANPRLLDFERREFIDVRVRAFDAGDADGNNRLSSRQTIRVFLRDLVETEDIVGRNGSTGAIIVGRSTGTDFIHEQWGLFTTSVDFDHFMTGDINGDGLTDLVAQVQENGAWYVGLSNGEQFVTRKFGDSFPNPGQYDGQMLLDVNGDGRDDLVFRNLVSGEWSVGISDGTTFNYRTFGATWNPNIDWTFGCGDFNGDGLEDIIGQVDSNGAWYVGISTGTEFIATKWGDSWRVLDGNGNPTGQPVSEGYVDINFADVNGDGLTDIIGRNRFTGRWTVGTSQVVTQSNVDDINDGKRARGASETSYVAGLERDGVNANGTLNYVVGGWGPSFNPNEGVFGPTTIGDYDGDGLADIAIQVTANGAWYIGYSNGVDKFNAQVRFQNSPLLADFQAIDVTGDGRDDIIGRDLNTGIWKVAVAEDNRADRWTVFDWAPWSPTVEWEFALSGTFDESEAAPTPNSARGLGQSAAAPVASPAATEEDEVDSLDALFASLGEDDTAIEELI